MFHVAARAAAFALFVLGTAMGGATAGETGYTFTILRGDSPIGTQSVSFARVGEQLTVDIRTEIAVKIAFVTVYRYKQAIQQKWKGDRLEWFEARTDDNGDTRHVQARATEAGIEIDSPSGRKIAPADIIPTGYWNREIINRSQGIDSKGRIVDLKFAPLGKRPVKIDGRTAEAEFFRVSGEDNGEIGYAPDGSWASLVQNERGNVITFIRDGGASARK